MLRRYDSICKSIKTRTLVIQKWFIIDRFTDLGNPNLQMVVRI